MNDFEVKELYDQVQKIQEQLNALKECNCKCCEEKL